MKKIAILADSGCQLPIGTLENQGIYIVPLTITMDNKAYLDLEEISALDVFNEMKATGKIIKTSQPSTGVIQAAINRIEADGYDHILALSIATGLSSTLSGMKLACDMADMPVTLIDTKGTATNHRYLIKVAKKLIDDQKELSEIESILESLINDSGTLITTPNLTHLKNGGRITPTVAMLGNLLKIVPVMKLNYDLGGRIDSLDKVRTIKKANLKIIEHMVDDCKINNHDYIITIEHVLSEELALEMKQALINKIGDCPIIVRELPSVVGAHMGVGGMGYQYIRKYEDVTCNE